MESNYEKVKENWRQKFLEMDQEMLIRKFSLKADEENLYIVYFSRKMVIDRKTGVISYLESEEKPGFNTVMMIYNMFHYAIENPIASNTMIPFRQVKRAYPFEGAYKRDILNELEHRFSGKTELLEKACIALNGEKMKQGDVGYLLPVYPFLKLAVLFWDKDEEFEAQANMLFDSNVTDFMHEENVVCMASDCVYYLTVAAGLRSKEIYAGN